MLKRNQPHPHDAVTLQLHDVSVQFGSVLALDAVTLTIAAGEQVAVVGPNGAGKSTLFNIIAGTAKQSRGRVRVFGSRPGRHICIGYVPQRRNVDLRFPVTVFDVVMMGRVGQIGLFHWPSKEDKELVQAALERVNLSHLAERQIGELSGGQQQRVFLARALAQGAELLLLDEPLTGLDLPSQEAILSVLSELRAEEITVLTATHDLNQASEWFSKVLLLNRKMVAYGKPHEVLTASNLAAAYGTHLHVLSVDAADAANTLTVLTDTCCDGYNNHHESVPSHSAPSHSTPSRNLASHAASPASLEHASSAQLPTRSTKEIA